MAANAMYAEVVAGYFVDECLRYVRDNTQHGAGGHPVSSHDLMQRRRLLVAHATATLHQGPLALVVDRCGAEHRERIVRFAIAQGSVALHAEDVCRNTGVPDEHMPAVMHYLETHAKDVLINANIPDAILFAILPAIERVEAYFTPAGLIPLPVGIPPPMPAVAIPDLTPLRDVIFADVVSQFRLAFPDHVFLAQPPALPFVTPPDLWDSLYCFLCDVSYVWSTHAKLGEYYTRAFTSAAQRTDTLFYRTVHKMAYILGGGLFVHNELSRPLVTESLVTAVANIPNAPNDVCVPAPAQSTVERVRHIRNRSCAHPHLVFALPDPNVDPNPAELLPAAPHDFGSVFVGPSPRFFLAPINNGKVHVNVEMSVADVLSNTPQLFAAINALSSQFLYDFGTKSLFDPTHITGDVVRVDPVQIGFPRLAPQFQTDQQGVTPDFCHCYNAWQDITSAQLAANTVLLLLRGPGHSSAKHLLVETTYFTAVTIMSAFGVEGRDPDKVFHRHRRPNNGRISANINCRFGPSQVETIPNGNFGGIVMRLKHIRDKFVGHPTGDFYFNYRSFDPLQPATQGVHETHAVQRPLFDDAEGNAILPNPPSDENALVLLTYPEVKAVYDLCTAMLLQLRPLLQHNCPRSRASAPAVANWATVEPAVLTHVEIRMIVTLDAAVFHPPYHPHLTVTITEQATGAQNDHSLAINASGALVYTSSPTIRLHSQRTFAFSVASPVDPANPLHTFNYHTTGFFPTEPIDLQ